MSNKINIRAFRILCVLCGLLFLGCPRSSDWVQFRGEGGRGASSTRISPPLGVRWKIKLQDNDEILESLNPPVVMGNTIYFGSHDGNFYALDADSGYMRWVFKSGSRINSIPYADKDQVYFGGKDGKLYALSRSTGEEIWNFSAYGEINSLVQKHGDNIIFVGDADAFYFLSPDGKEQYRLNNPGWYNYTFLVDDGIIYHGTGTRTSLIGPFDIHSKEFLWYLPFEEIRSTWYSFSAVKGDLLYMGTADIWGGTELAFYAINRHTGLIQWEARTFGVFSGYSPEEEYYFFRRNMHLLDFMAPAVWRDYVIFAGGDCVVRAFHAKTGAVRWEQILDYPVSSAPTIAGGRVYFGVMGDDFKAPRLVCLSARDGRLLWDMEIEGSILSAPVIAGKRIVFGTDESVFYVMEQVF
ncbi:MAG: PQQ-binding-like beta-propeller repeat protein [Treponema sp.]|nr:PQQ-binding-like beta-propeller repeat protein [Treponema sp.]